MNTKGGTATFASEANGGTCPGSFQAGAAAKDGNFPATIFYGGLLVDGNSSTTVNFGPGQYVMAGALNTQTQACGDGGCVFAVPNGGHLNGSSSGTMFLFTDANYPGTPTQACYPTCLSSQWATIPNVNNIQSKILNLKQGDVELKNQAADLTGVKASAGTDMAPYNNILFWQDRRNSGDTVDQSNGSVTAQTPCGTCNVTSISPRLILGPGGGAMNLTGVLYQPRGAWFEFTSGNSTATGSLKLQLVTGALVCAGNGNGCGSATATLLSPTAPIIEFVTALIQ
jgi:hypothetical protein